MNHVACTRRASRIGKTPSVVNQILALPDEAPSLAKSVRQTLANIRSVLSPSAASLITNLPAEEFHVLEIQVVVAPADPCNPCQDSKFEYDDDLGSRNYSQNLGMQFT